MSDKDAKTPIKDSEKAGVIVSDAAGANTSAPASGTAPKESKPQAVSRRNSGGNYICGCSLCICGGAVEYPGDVCYTCIKFH
ncbi:12cd6c88-8ac3-4cad-b20a-fe24abf99e92 [Thermothielavioides terrestris]|uniref:Uncharacterized protein n=2 Tax=Thermothielavioides terrestris TaxID=2587410 RepID=G2RCQ4_THETT|nr:uncharacterized protein THITE_156792 [Thermothielavioides terrestris NRRL 8126]AEO70650.1 hypothetical protein THITE_156792 [Thermothielavioides terrestris NRRL 8126]SPQ18472.1 12cd6c88-8ac3-4cad-b20a-fe24abf99e92 [Thermothielavioides terrestris]